MFAHVLVFQYVEFAQAMVMDQSNEPVLIRNLSEISGLRQPSVVRQDTDSQTSEIDTQDPYMYLQYKAVCIIFRPVEKIWCKVKNCKRSEGHTLSPRRLEISSPLEQSGTSHFSIQTMVSLCLNLTKVM